MTRSSLLGALLCAVIPFAMPAGVGAQSEALQGVVYRAGTGVRQPVPFATVELVAGDGRRQAVGADDQGRYRFEEIAAGRYLLRVSHIGYRTYEATVSVGNAGLRVDVSLTLNPVRMPGVLVHGRAAAGPTAGDSTASAFAPGIAMRMLEQGTGLASAGFLEAVSGLPGGRPPDDGDVLLLRGSALDLKSVSLDGAPVYTPFHVGGLLPSFDEWLVGSGSIWVGAAPAERDGGLNYILDFRTRAPDRSRVRASAGLDLLGARAGLSVPLADRGGLLLGGRGLHNGMESVMDRSPSPYGYRDALGRVDLDLGGSVRLRATGFWNEEQVRLDYPSPDAERRLPDRAEWGNSAGSVEIVAPVAGAELAWTAARGRYDAGLPLGGSLPAYASGTTTRTESAVRVRWPVAEGGSLRAGLSVEGVDGAYSARGLDEDGATRVFDSEADTWMWSGHGDLHRPMGRTGSVRLGLRVSQINGERPRLAPRLGFAFSLSDQAVLAFSAGRYHQIVTAAEQEVPAGLVQEVSPSTPVPIVRRTLFELATANHVVVSLDQMLTPRTRLGLDGYYKRFSGLGLGGGQTLTSSGVDLRVRRGGDRFAGWVGYSLSWHWTEDRSVSDRFSGRQLLSAGLRGQLSAWSGLDLTIAYGGGLPLTAIANSADGLEAADPDFDEPIDIAIPDPTTVALGTARDDPALTGGPSGDFLRLDAGVHGLLPFRWGGREHVLKPYLKLLNALDRRDALFYYFEPWRGNEPRPLADLSVLPVLGLEWRF